MTFLIINKTYIMLVYKCPILEILIIITRTKLDCIHYKTNTNFTITSM